jgi:hypothetical protein
MRRWLLWMYISVLRPAVEICQTYLLREGGVLLRCRP